MTNDITNRDWKKILRLLKEEPVKVELEEGQLEVNLDLFDYFLTLLGAQAFFIKHDLSKADIELFYHMICLAEEGKAFTSQNKLFKEIRGRENKFLKTNQNKNRKNNLLDALHNLMGKGLINKETSYTSPYALIGKPSNLKYKLWKRMIESWIGRNEEMRERVSRFMMEGFKQRK